MNTASEPIQSIANVAPPTPTQSIRHMTLTEQKQLQQEQAVAFYNAGMKKTDGGAFFLEYLRYRDKKIAQSPTKLAQALAKSKADDLSKSTEEAAEAGDGDVVRKVAEELGVSAEQLVITVSQGAAETTAFSSAIKGLATVVSQKDISDRYESKMSSGEEPKDPDAKEPSWAAKLRAKASQLEAAAEAVQSGSITTGEMPGTKSLRIQAQIFRDVADLLERQTGPVNASEM